MSFATIIHCYKFNTSLIASTAVRVRFFRWVGVGPSQTTQYRPRAFGQWTKDWNGEA